MSNRKELADKLEAMCCNAPRAGCNTGRECDCTILRKAAKQLRADEPNHPTFPRFSSVFRRK